MNNRPLKIVLTGPECSGKSTMSTILSEQLSWPHVGEFAREYFTNSSNDYTYQDVVNIAKQQKINESTSAKSADVGIICDTDLLTIFVWAKMKFGEEPDWVLDTIKQDPADLYLLCKPGFGYELDPLREDYRNQDLLFDYYLSLLLSLNLSFIILAGDINTRTSLALNAIEMEVKELNK